MKSATAKRKRVTAIVRRFRPGDRQACRRLWAELTEWHRRIYGDSSIGGSNPGSHFDVHLKEYGSENIWVA